MPTMREDTDPIDHIEISKREWFANTEGNQTMRPLDHIIYPNRHERRKALAPAAKPSSSRDCPGATTP